MKNKIKWILDKLLIPFALVYGIFLGIYIVARMGWNRLTDWANKEVEKRGWKLRGN